MSLFRERLLANLIEAHAISPELVAKLLAWKHSGSPATSENPSLPSGSSASRTPPPASSETPCPSRSSWADHVAAPYAAIQLHRMRRKRAAYNIQRKGSIATRYGRVSHDTRRT